MKIKHVTITGADNNTDINDLIEISKKYPFVEWGILFSPTRNLKHEPRYPSIDWVLDLKEKTKGLNMKFSAHVCGDYTREFLENGTSNLVNENIKNYVTNLFDRAQLNFNATKCNVSEKFYELIKNNASRHPIIIQYNKTNSEVCQKIIEQKIPVHFLYDGSGGRGVLPNQWQGVVSNHLTGYAGGLNPNNLEEALAKINEAVGDNEIWIDTETGVRSPACNSSQVGADVLDFDKVAKFLEIASKYTK